MKHTGFTWQNSYSARAPDEPDEPDEPDRVSSTAARDPPTTRAGGQDDGRYTNSLKFVINESSPPTQAPRNPTWVSGRELADTNCRPKGLPGVAPQDRWG